MLHDYENSVLMSLLGDRTTTQNCQNTSFSHSNLNAQISSHIMT